MAGKKTPFGMPRTKKVPSPTGRPSRVRAEIKVFGKAKPAKKKRPAALVKAKVVKKKPVPRTNLYGKVRELRDKSRRAIRKAGG